MAEAPEHHQDRPEGVAEQASLPFGESTPIPFELTARARRVVDPEGLPRLEVITDRPRARGAFAPPSSPIVNTGAHEDDDASEQMRRARARALRHAGASISDIAAAVGGDELDVHAWVDDVRVDTSGPRLRPVPTAALNREASERRAAWEQVRRGAREAASERLDREDGHFAVGLALLAGGLECGPHTAILATGDQHYARAAVRWLLAETDLEPRDLRIVLQTGPDVAADVAVHAWAEALGIEAAEIRTAIWRQAPERDGQRALIRLGSPALSARLAGWLDAFLARD